MRSGSPGTCRESLGEVRGLGEGRAPPAASGLPGSEPEEQFEVVAHVGELGGQVIEARGVMPDRR
jgi:hypothetical protein